MIEVELNGGLGNQMFQYAAGRALQLEAGASLMLDTTILDNGLVGKGYTKRDFELRLFPNITSKITTKSILNFGAGLGKLNLVQLKASKWFDRYGRRYATWREQELTNRTSTGPIPERVKLEGYFQSQRYFINAAAEIRVDFTFPEVNDSQNRSFLRIIEEAQTTVSVHVRRSDYLTDIHKDNHPVCSIEYYEQSIETIRDRVGSVRCVVFSDDIPWAKENLKFLGGDSIFVSHNSGSSSYEDMRLMSLCSHNIIANSSFSWWGAWLSDKPNKVIIAPQRWFGSGKEKANSHIAPSEWIRL
jgi:hypothetical protein